MCLVFAKLVYIRVSVCGYTCTNIVTVYAHVNIIYYLHIFHRAGWRIHLKTTFFFFTLLLIYFSFHSVFVDVWNSGGEKEMGTRVQKCMTMYVQSRESFFLKYVFVNSIHCYNQRFFLRCASPIILHILVTCSCCAQHFWSTFFSCHGFVFTR